MQGAPKLRDIVLLGGGHAHVQVLKAFGMRPEPGVRLTIVAREPHSPYSGMLPGFVAGHYAWDDLHIDLARLSAFADARFVPAAATGLDLDAGSVLFADRPPLRYDVVSVNTGGVPGGSLASDFIVSVKPIGRFLPAWERLVRQSGAPTRLAIVGGGPGGVELALAIARRHPHIRCALVDAGAELLPDFAPGASRRLLRALGAAGVDVRTEFRVVEAAAGRIVAADGREVDADQALWTTGVEAPAWPTAAGLETDAGGFIAVRDTLQSVSHPQVFAAGDIAALRPPRPKSGVYAVRQGAVLADNLRRQATGRGLRAYRAQRKALAIVGVGGDAAVASRGRLCVAGRWVWRWKQWLDQRFMERFSQLPEMPEPAPAPGVAAALRPDAPDAMRCGGCGAKLGADILRRVLQRLAIETSPATVRGIGDDAALVAVGPGHLAVSCDGFRAMLDDPYRFGRISAHHALNDLFAMGAKPTFALALATVPAMADAMMEEDLFQMMSGALAVFRDHGVDLVGGHSAEGAEQSLAFTVAGRAGGAAFAKDGLASGERLVLTKPVGTGAVLAGAMRARTRADHLVAAVAAMDTSNAAAADILAAHGAAGCTDVTGFGLLGHLTEMTRASGVGARLHAARVPRLPGAVELLATGIESSLQASNERALADFEIQGGAPIEPTLRVLADPQTAGGLLAGVPEAQAERCVAALRGAGYPFAAVIGEVTPSGLQVAVERQPAATGASR